MPNAAPDTIDFARAFAALARDGAAESALQVAGQSIRLLAFAGTGGWHRHDAAEETVIVWSGAFDARAGAPRGVAGRRAGGAGAGGRLA